MSLTGSSGIRETILMIILELKSWIRIRILRLETEPWPNYHRSVTKFWDSSIYRWEKVKKNDAKNFALLLWPPKKACGFGPVWAVLETVFQFVWAQKGLNGPKSHRLGQGITILYWWGPWGAILGHFGVILGLRARGWGLLGAYFSPIWLSKWLEWPKN